MTGPKQSLQLNDFLSHVLEAVDRIVEYTKGMTYSDFCRSTRDQDAVIRNFEVIGEACRNIDQNYPDFVIAHPELPIRSAYDMRNALSHGYFGVDLENRLAGNSAGSSPIEAQHPCRAASPA
jgi:uncharacterized protein with HEPN domain